MTDTQRTADEKVTPLYTDAILGVHQAPHWCVGKSRRGCVAAVSPAAAQALFKTLTGEDAISCKPLPYGASPYLNVIRYPSGGLNIHGYFCFEPSKCAGYSSCPQNRACSE